MQTLEQITDHLDEAARLLMDELGDSGDNALQYVLKAIRAVEAIPESGPSEESLFQESDSRERVGSFSLEAEVARVNAQWRAGLL